MVPICAWYALARGAHSPPWYAFSRVVRIGAWCAFSRVVHSRAWCILVCGTHSHAWCAFSRVVHSRAWYALARGTYSPSWYAFSRVVRICAWCALQPLFRIAQVVIPQKLISLRLGKCDNFPDLFCSDMQKYPFNIARFGLFFGTGYFGS